MNRRRFLRSLAGAALAMGIALESRAVISPLPQCSVSFIQFADYLIAEITVSLGIPPELLRELPPSPSPRLRASAVDPV